MQRRRTDQLELEGDDSLSREAGAEHTAGESPSTDPIQTPKTEGGTTAATAPRYVIDLDLAPKQRWASFMAIYKDAVLSADAILDAQLRAVAPRLGPIVRSLVETASSAAASLNKVMYIEDIRALAELTGLPLGRAIALQLIYEASALCTSIVADMDPRQRATTCPAHIRTMDWEMDFLRPLTVELVYVRDGKPLFICTTWAGYVGVLTGMRTDTFRTANNFSVSVNFRAPGDGTIWTNLNRTLDGAWPIGFLVRHALEKAADYEQATHWLRYSDLIAPCYFTVAGTEPQQAMLVTRGRKRDDHLDRPSALPRRDAGADRPRTDDSIAVDERMFEMTEHGDVVQANADWWATKESDPEGDIMSSYARRESAHRALQRRASDAAAWGHGHGRTNERDAGDEGAATAENGATAAEHAHEWSESLWAVVSHDLICNDITIYGTIMVPARLIYETRIPSLQPVAPGSRRVALSLRAARVSLEAAAAPSSLRHLAGPAFPTCAACGQCFDPALNAPGRCSHVGAWHAAYKDCALFACGKGLGPSRIGLQHWSCCFATDKNLLVRCSRSPPHTPQSLVV
jgi:hypothetical protein